MVLQILVTSHRLISSDTFMSKRELFYHRSGSIFPSQRAVDQALERVACYLNVPRRCLHILNSPKGLFAGEMEIVCRGANQKLTGGTIPEYEDIITLNLKPTTPIVLVEKHASFLSLSQQLDLTSMVLITGRGYPDISTRRFLNEISKSHPRIYAIADYDPYGLDIIRTYRHGSGDQEKGRYLSCKSLNWIGLKARDVIAKRDGGEVMRLSARDRKKIRDMLQYTTDPDIRMELCKMAHLGYKGETEILTLDEQAQIINGSIQEYDHVND